MSAQNQQKIYHECITNFKAHFCSHRFSNRNKNQHILESHCSIIVEGEDWVDVFPNFLWFLANLVGHEIQKQMKMRNIWITLHHTYMGLFYRSQGITNAVLLLYSGCLHSLSIYSIHRWAFHTLTKWKFDFIFKVADKNSLMLF